MCLLELLPALLTQLLKVILAHVVDRLDLRIYLLFLCLGVSEHGALKDLEYSFIVHLKVSRCVVVETWEMRGCSFTANAENWTLAEKRKLDIPRRRR